MHLQWYWTIIKPSIKHHETIHSTYPRYTQLRLRVRPSGERRPHRPSAQRASREKTSRASGARELADFDWWDPTWDMDGKMSGWWDVNWWSMAWRCPTSHGGNPIVGCIWKIRLKAQVVYIPSAESNIACWKIPLFTAVFSQLEIETHI